MAVTKEQLTALYLAYFGRPPDFDGLNYYLSPAQSGLTLEQLEINFSASPESQRLYATTSTAQLIDDIYMNLFNRHAEPDGLTFWSNAINNHEITPAGAAYAILNGAQNADLTTVQNKLAIAALWDQHLDTSAEIIGYAGDSASAVARAFLATVTDANLDASTAGLDAAISNAIAAAGHPFTLQVNAPSVTEGDSGTKTLTYTIQLDHAPTSAVTINYQTTTSGSATANSDFAPVAGTVTFAAGQQVATVTVTINGDTAIESDETVDLMFSGSVLSNSGVVATGTIVNDDSVPTFTATVSNPVVDEGNTGTTTLAFVITLDHVPNAPVTLSYVTSTAGLVDAATAGTDFIATGGSVTFAAGQTTAVVNVTVNGDVVVENNEQVSLVVTGSSLTGTATGTGTITNDDTLPQLTTAIDTINVVSTTPVTIRGIVDGTTPGNSTFSVGDTIHGNNVTTVELDVAVGGTGAFAYMDGVSTVNVVAGVGTGINFNALQWMGVQAVNLSAGVNGLTVHLTALADNADLGIGTLVGGQISATYQDGLFADIWNTGKGGALYEAGADDVTIHLNTNGASAGAFFSASNDLVLGDIVIDGNAKSASAFFGASVFNGKDLTVGDITMSVGNSSTNSITLVATGDVNVGAVGQIAGDSATENFNVTATGDVTIASIAQAVGDSAFAGVDINGTGLGGDLVIGGIAQVGGNSAVLSVEIDGSGAISVGDISQLAGSGTTNFATIDINETGNGDVTVGNVTQQAGGWATVSVSTTGSGDIVVGDVTQGVSLSDAWAFFYADQGSITVGDVSQVAGTSANATAWFSATVTGSGDITVGDISQAVGGTGNTAEIFVYGSSVSGTGGDVTVGNVSQVVGSGGFATVSITADGDGVISVGDVSQVVGASGVDANVHVYGSSDVTVGDVSISLGAASASRTTAGTASLSITGSGDVTVGDISVVAGANQNAYAFVSNSGSGDVVIGDVTVSNGGNTNTAVTNTDFAQFFAKNLNTTGDLTVGNVTMSVGNTNSGTLSVSLDGTFNQSLGDLTIGDIDVTLADRATFNIDISATQVASTTTSATNVVNVGDLTVGDINVVAGTNASVDISIDHSLFQSGLNNVGGDLGDTNIGAITVAGGVGAQVTVDIEVSNTVQYTTSGSSAVTVNGNIGDVTLGGVVVGVDDGGSISVSIDIFANGSIGNVSLGDLKAIEGVSGTVENFDVSVSGTSIGNVSIGDIALIVGEQGGATSGIDVFVKANAGDLGNVTVGDIDVAVGQSGDQQTISLTFSATGDIGAVKIGNVTMEGDANASLDGLALNVIAGGDIASFAMGDYTLKLDQSAQMSTQLHAHISAANIGDVSFGDELVNIGLSASATSDDYVHITATGNIGNVTFGDIVYHLSATGANTSSGIHRTVTAGGKVGNVTLGDITLDANANQTVSATASASVSFGSGLYLDVSGVKGVGDVKIGDVNLTGVSASGSQYMSVSIDASGVGANVGAITIGDVNLTSVNATNTTADAAWLYVTVQADHNVGDVKIGNVNLHADSGNAWFTMNVSAGNQVNDLTVGDVNLVALNGGQAYFEVDMSNSGAGAAMTSHDVASIGTISFSADAATGNATANIYAGTADVSIAGITVHGTGAAQFGGAYNLSVTGAEIDIGTIAFDVSATNAAYNISGVLGSVAGTTTNVGTVDYSLYVLSGTSATLTGALETTAMTIDVSGYNVMNVIGSDYNDKIIVSAVPGSITGGAGKADQFDFTFATVQNDAAAADVAASEIYTITDFKAGPSFGEKIWTGANNFDNAHYAEKSAASLTAAATVALSTMNDPLQQSTIVAVQVGSDTYVFVDTDGGHNIDTIVKLAGVQTSALNFADFGS